jgi:hypothetical protein
VAAADFFGTGRDDLVVGVRRASIPLPGDGSYDPLQVYPSNADGTFAAPQTFYVGQSLTAVAVGDFNKDGRPDLVVAALARLDPHIPIMSSVVVVLLNNGSGSFTVAGTLPVPAGATDLENQPISTDIKVGDFNGDGNPDLALVNVSTNVTILLGNGVGSFGPATTYAADPFAGQPGTAVALAVGDVNGDGHLDLVTANNLHHTVSVLLGAGSATFNPPNTITPAANGTLNGVALSDLDGDGRLDLVVSDYANNAVSVMPGNGDGTFGVPDIHPLGMSPWTVTSADLNGDHKPDLLTRSLLPSNTAQEGMLRSWLNVQLNTTTPTPFGSPAQRFVSEVYRDLLHRPVDQGGLDNWSRQFEGLIVQGIPLAQAEGTIVYWIETDPQHEYFTNLVSGWYQQYLGRLPGPSDQANVTANVHYLAVTVAAYPGQLVQPEMQVCLNIVLSPEYAQLHGSSNQGFVEGLYQDALGRTAVGDAGAANFVQQLDAGTMTWAQAAQTVLLSGEYETNQVAGWYEQFLDRPVGASDAAHVQALAQALQLGVPETWVIASILGDPSQEYFSKVLP